MTDQEIIQHFFKNQCDKIKDRLPDCELLRRQYDSQMENLCKCKHNGVRNKYRNIVRKNLQDED